MTNLEIEKVNSSEFYLLDYKHLKSLLLSKTFEGEESEKIFLLKNLEVLVQEFSNIPHSSSIEEMKNEWNKRYSSLKFQVYKSYGYTSKY